MNRLLLIIIASSYIFCSCSPKSYCFFNAKERLFYILEKKDYRIKYISVARTDSIQGFKRNFELDPVVKSYKIVDDSVINQDVYIFIWTNDNVTYSLKLEKKDWSKDTVFKCRHLIK